MIRQKYFPTYIFLLILNLSVGLFTACSEIDNAGDPERLSPSIAPSDLALSSATAFQPLVATPTPDQLQVWISPALPKVLRNPIEYLSAGDETFVELVEDPIHARVRVEPGADLPLAEWVYAFVAPFPTVQDGGSLDGIRELWFREGDAEVKVYASASTVTALEGVFGKSSPENVIVLAEEVLLEVVWSLRPAFAIVPFDALVPRWKVLEIDGVSPIRKNLHIDSYPLKVSFGLSGDPSAVAMLLEELSWPSTNRDENRLTTLVMTGTTALTRATAWKMNLRGATYPGEKIGVWMREADLLHVSNEVVFSEACPPPDPFQEDLIFCGDPFHVALLDDIGVDLIELTGNHVMDWGPEAFLYTLDLYRQRGWKTFGGGENLEGARRSALVEHNSNRLAFIGCNSAGPQEVWATEDTPGAAPCEAEQLFREAGRLRAEGYVVIFTFQRMEGAFNMPAQADAFREAVDAGAVIVSGSQAHQPYGFEFYGDGFIHFGLGNLFFDQMQSPELRQEFLDRHVIYDGRHISTELLTAMLEDYAQPRPMTPEERVSLLTRIFTLSGW